MNLSLARISEANAIMELASALGHRSVCCADALPSFDSLALRNCEADLPVRASAGISDEGRRHTVPGADFLFFQQSVAYSQ